jgi:SAM-dependent methyltransferase
MPIKQILRKVKRTLFPSVMPVYEQSAAGLPTSLLAQLAPYLKRHGARFNQRLCMFGRCVVCGNATAFFCDDLAIARESLACAVCGTTSRYRSLARGLLRAVNELAGAQADSLTALKHAQVQRPLRIYDTQTPFYYHACSYPLPDLLAAVAGIEVQLSLYRTKQPLGIKLDGKANLTNQNLERLTFPEASFDIVITSDVMEHVRQDALAHAEIRRVLKPGGVYLFTVPHQRNLRATLQRVVVHDPDDPAKDEYVMEKEYHGDTNDPENAALAYRVYGTDIDETLARLGFKVDYTKQDFPEQGIVNTELFYCRVRT